MKINKIMIMRANRDFYALFGLDRSASAEQIKSRFYRLSLKYHPDQDQSSESAKRYKEILEAYNTLKYPVRRKQYDLLHIQTPKADVQKAAMKEPSYHWQEWAKSRYTERGPISRQPIRPTNEAEEREDFKIRVIALASGLIIYLCTVFQAGRKK